MGPKVLAVRAGLDAGADGVLEPLLVARTATTAAAAALAANQEPIKLRARHQATAPRPNAAQLAGADPVAVGPKIFVKIAAVQVNDFLPLSRRDPTRFEGAALVCPGLRAEVREALLFWARQPCGEEARG